MSDEEWPGGRASSSTDLEAAAWCFRLKETPTEALLAEFQSWVAASKTNAEAFANAMLVAPMKPAERERIEQFLGNPSRPSTSPVVRREPVRPVQRFTPFRPRIMQLRSNPAARDADGRPARSRRRPWLR